MNPHQVIRNRYRLIEPAGAGGQGEVWKAVDQRHSRQVALKILVNHSDPDRMLQEARVLLELKPHSSLPILREDFFEDGRYILVSDWIEGKTLQAMLDESDGGLPFSKVIHYLEGIASALDHLHHHTPPVVHRDVKPANVLIDENDRVFLVDYGTAGSGGERSLITRSYSAPEDGGGTKITQAADIYSLAATAFALLCGTPPKPGFRPIWHDVSQDQVPLIERTLTRALSYDPSRRHGSAREFVEALRVGGTPDGNLRIPLSPFIGRVREANEVIGKVRQERLVTLVGTGGLGKTRLAEYVASEVRDEFPDGAWFIALAEVSSAGLVAETIANSLDIDREPSHTVEEVLIEHFLARQTLLVLDNCEHVAEECALLVSELLSSSPGLRVLATSRAPLGVEGEIHLRISPMTVPRPQDNQEAVASCESVQLFVDRARRTKPNFRLAAENLAAVVSIVNTLEGIPLAIELAAARTRTLNVSEISARLTDRFSLLSSRLPGRSPRLRSLRETIDWSHELLSASEARLFAAISVFAGGFTLEAAQTIAGDSEITDDLAGLVDQSIVMVEESNVATRYRILETLRAYGAERLRDSGETPLVRQRHLKWCTSFAQRLEEELGGPIQRQALNALAAEHENFRAALGYALESANLAGLQLAASLWRFWEVRGHHAEGRRWLGSMLAACNNASSFERARALRAIGGLALRQGDLPSAKRFLEEGLGLARDADEPRLAGAILTSLAVVSGLEGDWRSERRLYEQCMEIWRGLGHKRGLAVVLGNIGTLSYEQGDLDAARTFSQESLEIRKELGDDHGIAASLNVLGLVTTALNEYESAARHFDEAERLWGELDFVRGVAIVMGNRALLSARLGRSEEALELYREAIARLREQGAEGELAESLHGLGEVLRRQGDHEGAETAYEESLSLRQSAGDRRGIAESTEALALNSLETDSSRAADLLERARQLRSEIGSQPASGRLDEIERAAARLDVPLET